MHSENVGDLLLVVLRMNIIFSNNEIPTPYFAKKQKSCKSPMTNVMITTKVIGLLLLGDCYV